MKKTISMKSGNKLNFAIAEYDTGAFDVTASSTTKLYSVKSFDQFIQIMKDLVVINEYQIKHKSISKAEDKNMVNGLIPCQAYDLSAENVYTHKADAFAYRTMLALDFDGKEKDNININDILPKLAQYTYFGWTTYSHQAPGKGNRYRFVLPLKEKIAKDVWNLHSEGLKIAFQNIFGVSCDRSAMTFAQLAYTPAHNASGKLEFFENTNELFDLKSFISTNKVEPKVVKEVQYDRTNNEEKILTEEQIANLCSILSNKLYSVAANPNGETINRKTLAVALLALNVPDWDIANLDKQIKKNDTNTSTERVMKDAKAFQPKHSGLLYTILSDEELIECGLRAEQSLTSEQKLRKAATKRLSNVQRRKQRLGLL